MPMATRRSPTPCRIRAAADDRVPVGARVEQALMSAIASGQDLRGRRRGLDGEEREIEVPAGAGSMMPVGGPVTVLSTNVTV
jgi:hypothetical protein